MAGHEQHHANRCFVESIDSATSWFESVTSNPAATWLSGRTNITCARIDRAEM